MNRMIGVAFAMGTLLTAVGCAHNEFAGRGVTTAGMYFGTVGITGYDNQVTIRNGSKINKLSFIGDGNTVTVEDQVTLPYIQFWGKNNVVSVPEYLMVRVVDVGHNNQVVRRPAIYTPMEEYNSPYVPPRQPVATTPEQPSPSTPVKTKPIEKRPTTQPATTPPAEPGADNTGETEP